MAEALIARLPQTIIATDINPQRIKYLKKKYGIKTAKNNLEAFNLAEIVILAVKPQNIAEVAAELAPQNKKAKQDLDEPGRVALPLQNKLIISIAAGISIGYLQNKLPGIPVIRAMPNNPALIGAGITALARNKRVKNNLFKKAEAIFKTVGEVVEVPEAWMNAVTALSGSGPAFIYQTLLAMIEGGIKAGLPKKVSAKLALQTMLGAVKTVKETGRSPEELIAMVASPGGTTVEGLKVLDKLKFKRVLAEAVVAAARKAKNLSKKWAQ